MLGDHNQELVPFLLYGWPINSINIPPYEKIPKNHAGAREFPGAIKQYLKQEIKAGTIMGPFLKNPFDKYTRPSPLNTREKPRTTERLILGHLSLPKGNAVNDYIPKGSFMGRDRHLKYPSVDALVHLINIKGPGCHIFKCDFKKAYRQMLIDPGDVHLLGYTFEGLFYFDTALTMGMHSSADICQRTTDALMHIYRKQGHEGVNYLDDISSAEIPENSQMAFQKLGILEDLKIWESKTNAHPQTPKCLFWALTQTQCT